LFPIGVYFYKEENNNKEEDVNGTEKLKCGFKANSVAYSRGLNAKGLYS
jgi:hypothetical protein